jgi:hypothetical protein
MCLLAWSKVLFCNHPACNPRINLSDACRAQTCDRTHAEVFSFKYLARNVETLDESAAKLSRISCKTISTTTEVTSASRRLSRGIMPDMGWFSIYITRYGVVRPDMGWSARKMSRIWGGPFMFRYGVVRPQNAQIWGGQVLCPDMGWSARKTLRYGVVRHRPNMGWSAHRTLGYGVVRYGVRIWGGPPTERSDMGWSDIARIWGGPPTKRSDMGVVRHRPDMGWSAHKTLGYGVVCTLCECLPPTPLYGPSCRSTSTYSLPTPSTGW